MDWESDIRLCLCLWYDMPKHQSSTTHEMCGDVSVSTAGIYWYVCVEKVYWWKVNRQPLWLGLCTMCWWTYHAIVRVLCRHVLLCCVVCYVCIWCMLCCVESLLLLLLRVLSEIYYVQWPWMRVHVFPQVTGFPYLTNLWVSCMCLVVFRFVYLVLSWCFIHIFWLSCSC